MTQPSGGNAFGKYQLLDRIAAGGMAEIYRARMTGAAGVSKPVVIKKILPHYAGDGSFVAQFINEARIAVGLSHGNIAQVFDFGEIDGEYFLAMELVDGQPLSRVLRQAKEKGLPFLPPPLAALIAQELCHGLGYAHTRRSEQGEPLNIIHRDVNPQNLVITYEGEVKIVDFGIAKAKLAGRKETVAGAVKGKYVYFSPEQARGQELDARTDVFAAGIVLYEMVCGRLPFDGKMVQVLRKIVQGRYPAPRSINPNLPVQLEQILVKALAHQREERYGSAEAFAEALASFRYQHATQVLPSALSHLMGLLFEAELAAEGRPVEVSEETRALVAGWKSKASAPPSLPKRRVRTKEMRKRDVPKVTAPAEPSMSAGERSGSAEPTVLAGPEDESTLFAPTLAAPSRALPRWAWLGAPVLAALLAALLVYVLGRRDTFAVELTSNPPGAELRVDGRPSPARTPALISNLQADHPHLIEVVAPGRTPWSQRIQGGRGEQVSLHAELKPLPRARGPKPRQASAD